MVTLNVKSCLLYAFAIFVIVQAVDVVRASYKVHDIQYSTAKDVVENGNSDKKASSLRSKEQLLTRKKEPPFKGSIDAVSDGGNNNAFERTVDEPTVLDLNEIDCNIQGFCDLSNPKFGVPTILISRGRSGSSSTWQTIGSLAGGKGHALGATEDAGRGEPEAVQFLKSLDPNEHGKCWMERILCRKQQLNRNEESRGNGVASSRIYGFKWKPWTEALNMTQSRQALEWLAASPHIKVIHSRRNVVDVVTSRQKHKNFHVMGHHCAADDAECIAAHKAVKVTLPTDVAMEELERMELMEEFADELLDKYRVNRVEVTYEKLYYNKTADEWMRIFKFLGSGPTKGLKMDKVRKRMELASTSDADRTRIIANYDEVVNALAGTRFEKYLD